MSQNLNEGTFIQEVEVGSEGDLDRKPSVEWSFRDKELELSLVRVLQTNGGGRRTVL